MRGTLLYVTIASTLLLGGMVQAAPVPAQLTLGEGRSWKGQIIRRDGDFIEYSTGSAAKPIRIGVGTIKGLNFTASIDTKKISALMTESDYKGAVEALEKPLAPFDAYRDIPSNLSRYYVILMELYYRDAQYEQALDLARDLGSSDSNPALQSKARVYTALSLMASGKEDEAVALQSEFGWNESAGPDTAAGELYVRAKLNLMNGENFKALEDAAKVVAFHSQDQEWIQQAELLCAEIYTEMGMLDSAEEVCRQITLLYKDSPEAEEANKLKSRIAGLRAEQ